jgi:hypothetical protein
MQKNTNNTGDNKLKQAVVVPRPQYKHASGFFTFSQAFVDRNLTSDNISRFSKNMSGFFACIDGLQCISGDAGKVVVQLKTQMEEIDKKLKDKFYSDNYSLNQLTAEKDCFSGIRKNLKELEGVLQSSSSNKTKEAEFLGKILYAISCIEESLKREIDRMTSAPSSSYSALYTFPPGCR